MPSYTLVRTLADLKTYLERENTDKVIAIDTEATSLDTRRAKLVGISCSLEPGTGVYIPIGHRIGSNMPIGPVVELLKAKCDGGYMALFYNAKYDLNILQAGTKWYPKRFEDALELVYMADPDRMTKGLKEVAETDLGVKMTHFEDLFTPEEQKAKVYDISTKSPERCTGYAAADADNTLGVWLKFKWVRVEQAFAVKVDNRLIDIVRRMEHNGGTVLNRQYIDEQIQKLDLRATVMREQIWRVLGHQFEIDSPKQLGLALFERGGIPSPGMTKGKNPQHKTDADTLDKLAKAHPVVELVITYRKVAKAKGTYFEKLKRLDEMGLPVRFAFNMFSAPTFRFAAPGGDPNKDGYTGVNIQAVSNGEDRDMMAVDLSSQGQADSYLEEMDPDELLVGKALEKVKLEVGQSLWNGDWASLGWTVHDINGKRFCFRETCSGCPADCALKGVDVTRRLQKNLKVVPSVRQSFRAPEGYTLVSFDYDRQELVIGANLSGEPRWIEALLNREDLHEVTAAAAFGMSLDMFRALPKEEYKKKRHLGKILNFATFYGATAYTLAMQAGISQVAAENIFESFKRNLPQLFNWINKVHIFARKNGYTTTYFGRKRWLKRFYENTDRKIQEFADRSSVNTCIQGTAAEVTRIAMVKVDEAFKKAGLTMKEVRFVLQLHDELMFLVRDDMVKTVVPLVKHAMEFNVKSWKVQLTCSPKIGKVWGQQEETTVEELLAA